MSEWKKVCLGDLVTIRTGKRDANFGSPDGAYPFFTCARQISRCRSYSFDCDAILLAGNCDISNMQRYCGKFEAYQRTYVLTNKDDSISDLDYIWNCLRRDWVKVTLGKMLGAAIQYIKLGMIKEFQIALPPLPTQKRIADILSAYDDLIENNRRRMEILEESARLIYRKMFGGKKANGTVAELASANDESYKAGCLPTEINYIDISSVSTGRIDTKTRMTAQNAPGRARRIARHGDVIWSNVRPNLKAYALVLEPEAEDVFSTGFTVLRAKKNLYSYLYLAVTQDKFVSYLEGCVSGATYPAVRPADFLRAEVYVPSEDEGIAFQEYVEPMYDQVRVFAEANRKLAEARDVLLPKLMN